MCKQPRGGLWCASGVVLMLVVVAGCQADDAPPPASADLLITNALVVDGTGAPAYEADIVIDGGMIVRIGAAGGTRASARRIIDAAGRVLAPGFIDTHAHGDAIDETWERFLAMGVTTVALGQDGRTTGSLWNEDQRGIRSDLAGWIGQAEEKGVQLNIVPFSGHGTLRYQTGVDEKSAPLSAGELGSLQAQLRADLEAGAFGLTSGLEYTPGMHADTDEMVALAKTVGECGGLVMSHMRTEDDDKIETVGIGELIAQGKHARVHISHLKIVFGKGAERAERLLDFIESARADGVELSADIYPYAAGYTGVAILFPDWALPPAVYDDVVASRRDELADYLEARVMRRNGPGALLFGSEPYVGKTLEQAAADEGLSFVDFLIRIGPEGGSGAHFTQDSETHDALVVSPLTAISTDGGPSVPHPRSTGTYAKLFSYYVEETGRLTVEEAVRKATGLPASILMLEDRGLVKEGMHADLVLFDPGQVEPRSDYTNPDPLAHGFDLVLINGAVAWEDGRADGVRHGRVLRHVCRIEADHE